jgi:hypothetical protein
VSRPDRIHGIDLDRGAGPQIANGGADEVDIAVVARRVSHAGADVHVERLLEDAAFRPELTTDLDEPGAPRLGAEMTRPADGGKHPNADVDRQVHGRRQESEPRELGPRIHIARHAGVSS